MIRSLAQFAFFQLPYVAVSSQGIGEGLWHCMDLSRLNLSSDLGLFPRNPLRSGLGFLGFVHAPEAGSAINTTVFPTAQRQTNRPYWQSGVYSDKPPVPD